MHLAFSADQETLRDAVRQLYAKESTGDDIRRAEAADPTGFDPALWASLAQMGLPTMGVPVEQGGGGASLADLAVVAEQHGTYLGSAPLLETMVVARLLARWLPADAAQATPVLSAGQPAGLALRKAVDGWATLVPGGSVGAVVLAMRGDDLVAVLPADAPADATRRPRPTLHDGPVADVALRGAPVIATGQAAGEAWADAQDTWRLLHAAAFAGLARRALTLAVDYVKERHQFGVPLGSFQTIQHRLADLHTQADAAHLLAHEAAWAAEQGRGEAAALTRQAFWYCGEVATASAETSLHYHGGYGFMEEYDIQLYVRRARAWRQLAGPPQHELREVARRRWQPGPVAALSTHAGGDAPQGSHAGLQEGMDFALDRESLRLQAEVRALLAEHLTDEVLDEAFTTGTMHSWPLHRALCDKGYLAAGWPAEVGGLGHSAVATTTLLQELYRAGAPVDGMGIAAMVGATLLLKGNDRQRTEVLPRILNGEVLCALGYSEPDAGSDVAAVQTRAVRDGDTWVINGQKMFTTMAHEAEYVFLLTRTGTADQRKHQGLTMFLVPMAAAGIEVTPVETLGGERTNITFYTDVEVPDSARVGEEGEGWSVMHAALVYERNSANWGEPAHLVASVAEWAGRPGPDGAVPLDDPDVAQRLARWDSVLEAGRLLLYRSAWMAAQGALPQVEGSMAKLHLTEAFVGAATELLELCGPAALLPRSEADAVLSGLLEHASRHALVTTIYGGSSEVQREIVAQRGLGLPRKR